jgi:hypothetical protein
MDIDPGGLVRNPFAAGALGALVGLKFTPGATWPERVANVVAGGLCAGYGAPALSDWLHVTSPHLASGLAFGVGLFGLSLAAAVWQGIRDVKVGEVITGWISRKS